MSVLGWGSVLWLNRDFSVPECQIDFKGLGFPFQRPAFRKNPQQLLAVAVVKDDHTGEFAAAVPFVDENATWPHPGKLPWPDHSTLCGVFGQRGDQFASGPVLHRQNQPSTNEGGQHGQHERWQGQRAEPDAMSAHGEDFSVAVHTLERQKRSQDQGDRKGIRGQHWEQGPEDLAEILERTPQVCQLIDSPEDVLTQENDQDRHETNCRVEESLSSEPESQDSRETHARLSYRSHLICSPHQLRFFRQPRQKALAARTPLTTSGCINPLKSPPKAERILVIRLGALGDVARTIPAVASLRSTYPRAHITWLVEPLAQDLVRHSPTVDELLVFPKEHLKHALRRGHLFALGSEIRLLTRNLRRGRFDLVADFHGLLKSALLSRLSGAPIRVGYAPPVGREGSWYAANHRVEMGPGPWTRHQRNAALVHYLLGAAWSEGRQESSFHPVVQVDPEARKTVVSLLTASKPGVVLHPGTSHGTPYKRWPASRFAALAQRLQAVTGQPCIITAGPDAVEQDLARSIVRRADRSAVLAPGRGTMADLIALLDAAPLVVAADSGPLQLASVLGTPVVQILGPTDPVENEPFPTSPARIVRVPQPCSPCRRGCAIATCMHAVDVDSVFVQARDLLGTRDVRARSNPKQAID